MKVKLISFTKWPEETCTEAACVCYDKKFTDIEGATERDKYLTSIINSGHLSIVEHANFTFMVEGVSRALTHQLVRHRIGISFAQQSQRYVKLDKPTYVIPESIRDCETQLFEENYGGYNMPEGSEYYKVAGTGISALEAFEEHMKWTWELYEELLNVGVPAEDARFVLPNGCTTNIVITANARELLHIYSLRCCEKSQWEIRDLANQMLELCKQVAPTIFAKAGPSCVRGPCPEGKKSCGNPKTINI